MSVIKHLTYILNEPPVFEKALLKVMERKKFIFLHRL
jgi:hypothetical protein